MLDLFQSLLEQDIITMYQGPMSQTILAKLAKQLRESEENYLLSKRLFAILIELGQNINHYSEQRQRTISEEKEVGCGMIVVMQTAENYTVAATNLIKTTDVERITAHCDYINSLNQKDLRKFYRTQRRATRQDGHYGGNIGFIEMVRKSNKPLKVRFQTNATNTELSILSIQVTLSRLEIF